MQFKFNHNINAASTRTPTATPKERVTAPFFADVLLAVGVEWLLVVVVPATTTLCVVPNLMRGVVGAFVRCSLVVLDACDDDVEPGAYAEYE